LQLQYPQQLHIEISFSLTISAAEAYPINNKRISARIFSPTPSALSDKALLTDVKDPQTHNRIAIHQNSKYNLLYLLDYFTKN